MIINLKKIQEFGRLTRPMFAALRGDAPPLPSAENFEVVCGSLHRGFTSARNAGAYANPWTIAGIGKSETRNCTVLARLWDPVIVGDLGRRFLIETLNRADPTGARGFPIGELSSRPYSVTCENCLAGDTANRMDIVIQSLGSVPGWTIVLEAKIDADLGERQLEKYANDLIDRNRLTGRDTFLILLAPNSPEDLDQAIAYLRWKDIASAAVSAVSGARSYRSTHSMIQDFADHIRDFDS